MLSAGQLTLFDAPNNLFIIHLIQDEMK